MANIAQTIVVVGKSTNSVTTPTTTAPSVAPTRGIRSSRAMISPRIDRDIDDGVVPPIRTNWASQAALSPKTTRRESVLVVQAVAGSSPVAYSPKNPAHAGVSSLGRVEWLSCGHQAGINLSAAKGPSTRRRAGRRSSSGWAADATEHAPLASGGEAFHRDGASNRVATQGGDVKTQPARGDFYSSFEAQSGRAPA
jgi:hypothetical protein